jgi:hypothetical protein
MIKHRRTGRVILQVTGDLPLNLAGRDLAEADLSHLDLTGADLRGCDLRGAILAGAQLEGADLRGARMRGLATGEFRIAFLVGVVPYALTSILSYNPVTAGVHVAAVLVLLGVLLLIAQRAPKDAEVRWKDLATTVCDASTELPCRAR